jgi:hypothetical protein
MIRLFRRRPTRLARILQPPHVLLKISLDGVNLVELDCEALYFMVKFGGNNEIFHYGDVKVTATPCEQIRARVQDADPAF